MLAATSLNHLFESSLQLGCDATASYLRSQTRTCWKNPCFQGDQHLVQGVHVPMGGGKGGKGHQTVLQRPGTSYTNTRTLLLPRKASICLTKEIEIVNWNFLDFAMDFFA